MLDMKWMILSSSEYQTNCTLLEDNRSISLKLLHQLNEGSFGDCDILLVCQVGVVEAVVFL